jgi:outer membrane immunogenic protein
MMKFLSSVALLTLGLAAPALAADLPVKAPPLVPVAIYSWTGFYAGINGGGGFTQDRTVIVNETFAGVPFVGGTWPGTGNFGSRSASGGFGGGQIGYNWQRDHIVFGLEADFEGSGITGSSTATLPYVVAPNTITAGVSERLDWFGTARGRIGWAWDRFMLYATGGFAYGQVKSTLSMSDTFGFSANITDSSTRTGYVVGAGGEYAFNNNWSVKAEYQYIDLGRRTLSGPEFIAGAPSPVFAVNNSMRYDYHTVRVGLNYKWGGPIVAKY